MTENNSEEYLSEIKKYFSILKIFDDVSKFKDDLNTVYTAEVWTDIMNNHVNKGAAVKNLMEIDKISMEKLWFWMIIIMI